MAQPNGKSRAAKAAKSRAKGPRKVTLTKLVDYTFKTPIALELPRELPATYSLDLAAIMGKQESGQPSMGSLYNFLISLVGEEQLNTIRQALLDENVPAEKVGGPALLLALTNVIGEEFGSGMGESPVSATS